MGGALSRSEDATIVHAGGCIDEYVSAAEIVLSKSHNYGATPEVSRSPRAVGTPQVALMRGKRFFMIPFHTVFHLVRRHIYYGISTTSNAPCNGSHSSSGTSSKATQSSKSFSDGEQKVDSIMDIKGDLESIEPPCNASLRSPGRMQTVTNISSKKMALQHRHAAVSKIGVHSEQKENVLVREAMPPEPSKWHRDGSKRTGESEKKSHFSSTNSILKNQNRVLHQLVSDDEKVLSYAADSDGTTERSKKSSIEDSGHASQRHPKLADHLDTERRKVLRGLQQNTHRGRSDRAAMMRRCTAGIARRCSEVLAAFCFQKVPALCVDPLTKITSCNKNDVEPKKMMQEKNNSSVSMMATKRSDRRVHNSTMAVVAPGSSRGRPTKMVYNHLFEEIGRVKEEQEQDTTGARVERLKLATGSDWINSTRRCEDATGHSFSQVRWRVNLPLYLVEEGSDRTRALQQSQQIHGKLHTTKSEMVKGTNDCVIEGNAEDVNSWQQKQCVAEFEADERSQLAYEVLGSRSLQNRLLQHLQQLYTGSMSISDILSSEQLARINEAAKAARSSHNRHTDPAVEIHEELERKRTTVLLKILENGKVRLGHSDHQMPKYNSERARQRREVLAVTPSTFPLSETRRPKLAEYLHSSSGAMPPSDHTPATMKAGIMTLKEDNGIPEIDLQLPVLEVITAGNGLQMSRADANLCSEHAVFNSLFLPDASAKRCKRLPSRRTRGRHRGSWRPHLATLNECSP